MGKEGDNRVGVAELESVEVPQRKSFNVGIYEHAYFTRPWHYHPEFELLLITKGFGTRMVGDHFEQFKEGDLILLGAYLPHAWISDPYFLRKDHNDTCESVYIQFKKSVFGTHFIDIPELQNIRVILKKAEQGVKIKGRHYQEIADRLKEMPGQKPIDQLLGLLHVLDLIIETDYEILASSNYKGDRIRFKSDKMIKAHNYVMRNFKNDINIDTGAEHIGMTSTSFCRLIKKHTNVTFSTYLNYVRINFAQKLISNTELPIKEIGYECGYSSISYFNQVFKKQTGYSPKAYRDRGKAL